MPLAGCTPQLCHLCRIPAGLGFCRELNLLSQEPGNVVSTCNTIYGLLLQHQRDARYREQLKQGEQELQGADQGVGPSLERSRHSDLQPRRRHKVCGSLAC